MAKQIFGLIMVGAGLAFGVYVGLWVCFIGGIIDIINEIKSPISVDALTIAWGVVKIFFAGAAGYLSALLLVLPGIFFIKGR